MTKVMFSIIIPIYNAGAHLVKCIESIKNQTMRDFECILVDDGSTDGSSEYIDGTSNEDTRFIAVHKTNGGESSARNAGLDASHGEWILYVDADDYVEDNTLEILYDYLNKSKNEKVDIIMFEYEGDYLNGKKTIHHISTPDYYGILDRNRAVSAALTGCSFACCKLYSSKLATSVRFSENIHWGPDTIYLLEVINKAEKVLNVQDVLYHYVQSAGSAARAGLTKKQLTVLDYSNWLIGFISENYPEHIDIAREIYINTRVNVYYKMSISDSDIYDSALMKKMYKEAHELLSQIESWKAISAKKRMKYRLFDCNPKVYCSIFKCLVNHIPGDKYAMYRAK